MINHRYVATKKGGPEVLEWQEFEPDPPQQGDVAVKVEAAGVLLADVLWQSGITPVGPKHPFTPGYDVVGVIDEFGPGVSGLERGQRVAAMIQYGGYTGYYDPQHNVFVIQGRYSDRLWVYRHQN